MSNYLIKLKPIGKFFFGGDMTFFVGRAKKPIKGEVLSAKEEEEVKFNAQYSSYIIKSEKFPQQTSLLGMLRFLLLRNHKDPVVFDKSVNKIIGKAEEVAKVIGKSSFPAAEEKEINNKYGYIKELSPCFLMNGDNIITRLPMDYGLETIDLSNGNALSYNDSPITLKEVLTEEKDKDDKYKKYSAKDGLSVRYGFVSKDKNGEGKDTIIIYDEKEIFIEDQRIGISRNIVTGKTEENALYKQINYRLADGFCFAFYAKINIDDIKPFNNQVVLLGADSSQFVIQIEPLKGEEASADYLPEMSLPSSNVSVNNGYCEVMLTSPTLIDKKTATFADFAITETIPFKCMQTVQISTETTKKTDNYDRVKGGIGYSERYELYQTGSVFYFRIQDNANEFIKEIESHKEFRQIGYNHYLVTNLTTNK